MYMHNNRKVKYLTISEFQNFTCNKEIASNYNNFKYIEQFDALKNFIQATNASGNDDALTFMDISHKKGYGEVITAKNYVGLIAMNDGTVIEILPKIAKGATDKDVTKKECRELLLKMLKTLKHMPFKSFNSTELDISKYHLFEIFIKMFINELKLLIQKGLKSDYILYQENENFLKGKLHFTNHLKHNFINQARFFVEYQLYDLNRAENKLIKTTLLYLLRFSKSNKNKMELRILLDLFADVDTSINIDTDFNICSKTRDMNAYEQILQWCKVFLKGNTFTVNKGTHTAIALLYDMNRLFEDYVAAELRKALNHKRYALSAQDKSKHLFDNKHFSLRPDIVVKHIEKDKTTTTVLDTKWKLLKQGVTNYGISQGDMYQMYAYGKKYHAKEVVLLYPKPEDENILKENINYDAKEQTYNVEVKIRFIDLLEKDEKHSITGLCEEFFPTP